MPRPPILVLVLAASLIANAVAALALLGYAPSFDAEAATGTVGAKAFARVISDGTFNQARNVNDVVKPSAGLYCLKLAVNVKNVVASLNSVSAARVVAAGLAVDGVPTGCPSGTDAVVVTREPDGNRVDAPFYVLMH